VSLPARATRGVAASKTATAAHRTGTCGIALQATTACLFAATEAFEPPPPEAFDEVVPETVEAVEGAVQEDPEEFPEIVVPEVVQVPMTVPM